jgi:large subunit ribosomal protein L29
MKPIKASALRELSTEELKRKLQDAQSNFFKLNLRKETRQMDDLVAVRGARRDIARMMTVLRQKASAGAVKGGRA